MGLQMGLQMLFENQVTVQVIFFALLRKPSGSVSFHKSHCISISNDLCYLITYKKGFDYHIPGAISSFVRDVMIAFLAVYICVVSTIISAGLSRGKDSLLGTERSLLSSCFCCCCCCAVQGGSNL